MNFLKLKPIGLRNIKTSIAVLLCLLLIKGNPVFATVAAVICMQDTVEHSVDIGKIRLIGTFLGGFLGILFLKITEFYLFNNAIPLLTAIGVSACIYLSNTINKPTASAISSLVLISIMLAPAESNHLLYAINRTIETSLGIVIAIIVNKYFEPSFYKRKFYVSLYKKKLN